MCQIFIQDVFASIFQFFFLKHFQAVNDFIFQSIPVFHFKHFQAVNDFIFQSIPVFHFKHFQAVNDFFPQQQNAMGSLHNIDFGVCWASWGGSGKKRVPGKFREGSGKVPGTG